MGDHAISDYSTSVVYAEARFGPTDPAGPPLRPPGGGGTDGTMEAKIAILETHVEHIRGNLSDIKSDVAATRASAAELTTGLAVLKTEVGHLPTKGFIVTAVGLVSGLVVAVVTLQEQLQKLLGLG